MSVQLKPDQQLTYTLFAHRKSVNGTRVSASFEDLIAQLGAAQEYISKDMMPMWRPSITADNSRTAGIPVAQLFAVVGDYDAGELSLQEASERLKQSGVEAYFYTTASHTRDKPRWRVVAPLTKSVVPDEYVNLVSRLNGALQGVLAPESWVVTQAWYYGRVGGVLFEDAHVPGTRLDAQNDIKPIPKPQRTTPKNRTATAIPAIPPNPIILDALQEAIKYIKADDRAIWIKVGMALSSLKDTPYADNAKAIWLHWSASSEKHKDADDKAWDTLEPRYMTYSYIFRLAESEGWLDTVKMNANLVINCIAQRREEWALLAAQLSPVAASLVVDEMNSRFNIPRRALNAELKEARAIVADFWRRQRLQEKADGRVVATFTPEDVSEQTTYINDLLLEHAPLSEFMQYGNELVYLAESVLPESKSMHNGQLAPPVMSLNAHTDVTLRERIEPHIMFVSLKGEPLGIPPQIFAHLRGGTQTRANQTAGLLGHPIVLRDGTILAQNGLDPITRYYIYGIPDDLPPFTPYSLEESRAAYQRLATGALQGFELMTETEVATAVGFILGQVERKEMLKAPGHSVQATTPSVGKTTLAQAITAIVTGKESPVWGFPKDEAEVKKSMLAILSMGPECIIFDNFPQHTTFKSNTIALVMTSPVYEDRVLGITGNRAVSTAVVIWLTGNNFKYGDDEVTRWLTLLLSSKSLHPEERVFAVDVVQHNIAHRWDILRDVIGIVSGYLKHGSTTLKLGNRFPDWSRLVREPIHWITGIDLNTVLRGNAELSDSALGLSQLVSTLKQLFGTVPFIASDVVIKANEPDSLLGSALAMLRPDIKLLAWTATKVNDVLQAYAGKGVEDESGKGWCIKRELKKNQKIYTIVPFEAL